MRSSKLREYRPPHRRNGRTVIDVNRRMNRINQQTRRPSEPRLGAVEISIVIPVFNEASNLSELGARIIENLTGIDYEVVLVDDGSTDRSVEEMRVLCDQSDRFRAVVLAKNYGQTQALAHFHHPH